MGIAGAKSFNCNHMPIIEQENVRKALAFWREGKRLDEVHDSYAFLSFYKVIESQFSDGKTKAEWITVNIEKVADRAAKRVAELRAAGIDVSRHLFDSGRCAVAHASLEGEIVDPDIPADRKRLSADLVIMEELARIYIRDELKVPDFRSLYDTRDRLAPWAPLLPPEILEILKSGGTPGDVAALRGRIVSIGLWPDGPIPGLERMTMHVDAFENGVVKIVLINERKSVLLVFFLDYRNGRASHCLRASLSRIRLMILGLTRNVVVEGAPVSTPARPSSGTTADMIGYSAVGSQRSSRSVPGPECALMLRVAGLSSGCRVGRSPAKR
jgi:hypothetical protein